MQDSHPFPLEAPVNISGMVPVTSDPSPFSMTVSSLLVDNLVRDILASYRRQRIALPARLDGWASSSLFSTGIENRYSPADLEFIKRNHLGGITTLNTEELRALQAVLSWNFMNIGCEHRSAIGAAGYLVKKEIMLRDEESSELTLLGQAQPISRRLAQEPAPAIERLLYNTLVSPVFTGNVRSVLPERYRDALEYLTDIRDICTRMRKDAENLPTYREDLRKGMKWAATGDTEIKESSTPLNIAVQRFLIATCFNAGGFMVNGDASRLRSFLTNSGRLAGVIRINTPDNPTLNRLAMDFGSIIHSLEVALTGSCSAASRLVSRMRNGEIVYDEIYSWMGFHHRLVNIELRIAFILFAYLLRRAEVYIESNNEYIMAKKATLSYPGLTTAYRDADIAYASAMQE